MWLEALGGVACSTVGASAFTSILYQLVKPNGLACEVGVKSIAMQIIKSFIFPLV